MYPPRKQERHCSKINIFSSRLNTTNLSLDFAIYSAISSKMPLIMCSKSEKTQCLHVVNLKQVVQSLFQISHILFIYFYCFKSLILHIVLPAGIAVPQGSLLAGLSKTWTWKVASIHSRNLLDSSQPAVLLL